MDKAFDLISIGDASVDAFLDLHKTNEHCRLDKETNELCLKYGEKILIDDSQFLLGGNACNVSVGVSRLGMNTVLITELGDDEFSEIILKGLKKENVKTSLVRQAPNSQTNFSIVLTFQKDKVLFARHIPRDHNFSLDGISTKWAYLTSMGKEWKGAYQGVLDYVQETGTKLAFNPGTTQIKEGPESFKNVIKMSDILFLNKNEAQEIFNLKFEIFNEDSMKEILNELKQKRPKTVVITDSGNGSYAIDENGKMFSIGVFPGEVLQKTGAGDAYTSGFLSAIISGESIQEAMRWGAINSTAVIQKTGAQTGLLTRNSIEICLKEHEELRAREI